MMNRRTFLTNSTAALLLIPVAHSSALQQKADASGQTAKAIPSSALLQPAELAQMLNTAGKPLMLQIGSHVLYAEAHVPGSEYAGAAGTSAGLQTLRERVSGLRKDQDTVLYCGCCPWERCPNIRPAYELLQTLGFTHVKTLYLADNFGADWVNKGYPAAKGR